MPETAPKKGNKIRTRSILSSAAILGLVMALSTETVHAEVKYPLTKESIRCLVLDESGRALAEKFIRIEKIYANAESFSYSVEVGVHASTD